MALCQKQTYIFRVALTINYIIYGYYIFTMLANVYRHLPVISSDSCSALFS